MKRIKNRAYYRMMARRKAWRKRRICKHVYGFEYYDNLHEYSKNKIHCSCPICCYDGFYQGHNTFDMRQYDMSTRRRFDAMMSQLMELKNTDFGDIYIFQED